MVGRVTLTAIPPAHPGDLSARAPPVERRFCHSIRPRSVSSTKMLSELSPTNPSARNPRYPIKRSSRTGCVSQPDCLESFFILIFHSNWNPGFSRVFVEILASVLIQEERCASAWLVIHSVGPRPWPLAAPVHKRTQVIETMTVRPDLLISGTPFS